MKRKILAWGVFKRDGEFLFSSNSRAEAREEAVDIIDDAGRKAIVKRVEIKLCGK